MTRSILRHRSRQVGRVSSARHWVAVIAALAGSAACGDVGEADSRPPGTPTAARALETSSAAKAIGLRFARIPAGSFVMGSPDDETHRQENEGPLHEVVITRDFELAIHEVTNAQFRAFVDATAHETEAERDGDGGFGIDFETGRILQDSDADWRAPGFPDAGPRDDHPVVMISWADAEAFCAWLSRVEGRTYRLPTEAEWEYAARGGTTTPRSCGSEESALATAGNVADAALRAAMPAATWATPWDDGHAFLAPVGSYAPNPFGLHDVHGNVWEWCADRYAPDYYATSPERDPQGPDTGAFRNIRGGGWFNSAAQNRSAQRIYFRPTFRYCLLSGFRVLREVE